MNNLLSALKQDAQSLFKRQYNETKVLVNKWEKTGLLEGLKDTYEKHGMAILLENQARQLIDEVSKTGAQHAEEWSGVALPLVRRIFSEIAAKDFVSVQPMNLPSGLVFFLDFKYGTDQPGFTTADDATHQANTVHGITKTTADPTEGLYGAGRFGYSMNDYFTSGSNLVVSGSIAVAKMNDVDFNANLATDISGSLIYKVTIDLANTNYDWEGVRAFAISGPDIMTYYPTHTKSIDESGFASKEKLTFIVKPNGTVTTASLITVAYHKQPLDYQRGDFEAKNDPSWALKNANGPAKYSPGTNVGESALDIPEINVALRSEPIVAKTRKLKAVWTPEFAQDLNAYHSIDAENELTAILSEYISMEIDLEILDMLILNAVTVETWSAKVGQVYSGSGDTFTSQDAFEGRSLAYTQPNWFLTLGTKIQKVSNKIHQKTMRGGANFMVLSPDIATIIESIPGFTANTDGNMAQFAMGVQKVGQFNNRFTVYKNPYMKENIILMGFKGSQFLETGAVYAPYIPLIMTPLIYDPVNFTPRKGVMTRYAKQIVRPEFYGKIRVSDLNYV